MRGTPCIAPLHSAMSTRQGGSLGDDRTWVERRVEREPESVSEWVRDCHAEDYYGWSTGQLAGSSGASGT